MAAALLESAAQAIICTVRDGRIVLANRQAEEMFSYPRRRLPRSGSRRAGSPSRVLGWPARRHHEIIPLRTA
ncbi:MAG: PAS domain-containing protein [Bryobacteraceae bacterium]